MSTFAERAADNAAWVDAMRDALARHDQQSFEAALDSLNASQDSPVLSGVRKITDDLQAALEQFRTESRLVDLAEREVPDARHRLAHVLKLTDDAAHRTMDLVEQSCPLIDDVAKEASRLLALASALPPDNNWNRDVKGFLDTALVNMEAMRGKLSDVLLTQGFQDLSGQVIRSVMKLVEELELALGSLVRIGRLHGLPQEEQAVPATQGHGPVVPGISHGDAVSGQRDVDAMLSGLGM